MLPGLSALALGATIKTPHSRLQKLRSVPMLGGSDNQATRFALLSSTGGPALKTNVARSRHSGHSKVRSSSPSSAGVTRTKFVVAEHFGQTRAQSNWCRLGVERLFFSISVLPLSWEHETTLSRRHLVEGDVAHVSTDARLIWFLSNALTSTSPAISGVRTASQ
jgi:hypothetical protein